MIKPFTSWLNFVICNQHMREIWTPYWCRVSNQGWTRSWSIRSLGGTPKQHPWDNACYMTEMQFVGLLVAWRCSKVIPGTANHHTRSSLGNNVPPGSHENNPTVVFCGLKTGGCCSPIVHQTCPSLGGRTQNRWHGRRNLWQRLSRRR